MDDKTRAKYAAAGITVRSLTQEECNSIPISMYSGEPSETSSPKPQAKESSSAPGPADPKAQKPTGKLSPEEIDAEIERLGWKKLEGGFIF